MEEIDFLRLLEEEKKAEEIIRRAEEEARRIINSAKERAKKIIEKALEINEEEIAKEEGRKAEMEIAKLRNELFKEVKLLRKTIEENKQKILERLERIILGLGD